MVGIGALTLFGSAFLPFALAVTLLSPPSTADASDYWVAALAIFAVIGACVVWLVLSLLIRRILHARSVASHPPASPATFADVPDPNVTWRPNHAAFPKRLVILVSILFAAIVVDAGVFLWITIPSSFGYAWSLVAVSAIATLIGATAGLLAALPFAVPSAVGVAADGVHLWYGSPYYRRIRRDLMPWTDLNILGMATPGGVDPATRLVRFLRIDSENAQVITAEWQRHRFVRSVASTMPVVSPQATKPPEPARSTFSSFPAGSEADLSLRGTMCARCRVHFPGIEGLRLLWCKVDRFYVCRKCWEDGCQEGHGRGMKAVSKPARIATAVVVVALFFALWYPAVVYDYRLTNAWQNASIVSISSLQAGQLVKVRGVISPGKPVAWGGHEVFHGSGGWEWFWNTTDAFFLRDVTGQVLVTTENWYIVYNGPHYAPYAQHTDMTMYSSGDDIQVVGSVGQLANGTIHLQAQVVALTEYVGFITVSPSLLATTSYYATPVVIFGVLAAGATLLVRRRRMSRRAAETQLVVRAYDTTAIRDPNLNWKPNGRGTDPRRRIRWALIFVAAGAGLLLLYPGLSPRTYSGYSTVGFVGTIVLSFEVAVVYVMLFGGVGHPSYVAVDDVGFRMWFDSPYDRHLNDTIFPWDQVKDIHMTNGKGAHWVLRWTTGEVTNLYMLNGRSLNLLLSEWMNRRMPAAS
jgi:hypothetical protein